VSDESQFALEIILWGVLSAVVGYFAEWAGKGFWRHFIGSLLVSQAYGAVRLNWGIKNWFLGFLCALNDSVAEAVRLKAGN
jgi:hypothetical protein